MADTQFLSLTTLRASEKIKLLRLKSTGTERPHPCELPKFRCLFLKNIVYNQWFSDILQTMEGVLRNAPYLSKFINRNFFRRDL